MDDIFITIDLSRAEFVRLVMSHGPKLGDVSRFQDDKLGYYNGSYDTWHWSESSLMNLPEDDLISLYFYLCKKE